jgi:hypothetical protein
MSLPERGSPLWTITGRARHWKGHLMRRITTGIGSLLIRAMVSPEVTLSRAYRINYRLRVHVEI